MTTTALSSQAREAYDSLAPAYDALTAAYPYERWLLALEELAVDHGLSGRRLLDVACGTGESFLPLMARGYEVTACDISAGMLALARRKAPTARFELADMRELPTFGRFNLVTCIDDALNYVLEVDELRAVLCGIARNLAPGGIAVWDLNTVAQYRGQFAHDRVMDDEAMYIGWRGDTRGSVDLGDRVEISIDVFARQDNDDWRRTSTLHQQRHWPRAAIDEAIQGTGMGLVRVRGQFPGAVLGDELDEFIHTKAIYVARAL